MRIENFRTETKFDFTRVSATIKWEDCDRPSQDIYFQTTPEFASDLSCNPHAFLVAGAIPALHYGEQRISIDAEICPVLQNGLMSAMGWILHWYKIDRKPVQIETKPRADFSNTATLERAGWFFSGGIDSLATLRQNHLNFPPEHPEFIKDGLTIYGISSSGNEVETADNFLAAFDRLLEATTSLAQEAGVTPIPVYTNIRQLNTDTYFWSDKFQGAALASVAHAFNRRLTRASIASTGNIPALHPHGSHPLLDPNYSSHDLRIQHDGIMLSRLEKTKLVADWDVALQNLKVCTKVAQMRSDALNCGKCDKCIRTMLALLALGKLDEACTFPEIELSEDLLVRRIQIKTPYRLSCYQDLIPHLEERGRPDLVRAIERIKARYYGNDWSGKVRKLAHKYFTTGTNRTEQLSAQH